MKKRYWYLLIILVQSLLCYIAFTYHFENGLDSSFCNSYDGLKNNFTLVSFVQEPIGDKGIFHFDFFQYPYGDYVYTADNTPLYALTMRWINHYVTPVSHLTIPLFNCFLLSNFVLCALLLFKFSNRYLKNSFWAFGLAILLPFFLEQGLRLSRGHYNLSLSSIFIFSFMLSQWYADRVAAGRSVWKVLLAMFLTAIVAFLIHGYYLPILTVVFGVFLFAFHIKKAFSRHGWKQLLKPFGLVLSIGLCSFLLMKTTDGYFGIRQTHAQGYDATDQRLSPSHLFQSFHFNTIQFPLRITDYGSLSESHQYLGHSFWALLILILGLSLVQTSFRREVFATINVIKKSPLLGSLTIVSFMLFAIACGDYFFDHKIQLDSISLLKWGNGQVKIAIALTALALSAGAMLSILFFLIKDFKRKIEWDRTDIWQLIAVILIVLWLIVFYFTNIIQFKHFPNLANPFFYLRKLTRIVEQFRSLARFAWPFSIFISFLLLYIYVRSSVALNKYVRVLVAIIVLALGCSQLSDWISYNRNNANMPNLFSKEVLQSVPDLEKSQYAAIFPVPFFMVGSEDYNVTIDDFNDFSKWLYQLSYKNNIPLMSSKLSRTPAAFADQMMDVLLNQKIEKPMLDIMDTKPILVIVSKEYMEQNTEKVLTQVRYPDIQKKAFEANKAQFDFIKNPTLKWLKTDGNYDFYEWKVQ